MFLIILEILCDLFTFLFLISLLMLAVHNARYQKIWNKEKAARLRIDPAISRAELCECYVMFCKRNNCKVDF